jgi:hypothetical protein
MALLEMATLKKALAETHPDVVAEFYLVSVDPERDTPERIDEYVSYFDDSFKGLTGDLAEIRMKSEWGRRDHFLIPPSPFHHHSHKIASQPLKHTPKIKFYC